MWTADHRRAADRRGLRYASDLTDAEWSLVEPAIPPAKRGGRPRDEGRGFPDGLRYVGSWVTANVACCFQLMETDDITLPQRWVADKSDLVEFEIVPVAAGKDTAAALAGSL